MVPCDDSVCGRMALANMPTIEQVFVNAPGLSKKDLTVKLFIARRKAENRLVSDEDFYICSLSNSVISYKGLMLPVDLAKLLSGPERSAN